ncbi:MAG: hypothetical protein HY738_05775 [Bacteroidia bacterium]|nr:hypothetical protein [Bacteroidia bacterium]
MRKTLKDNVENILKEHRSGLHVERLAELLIKHGYSTNLSVTGLSKKISAKISHDLRVKKRKSVFRRVEGENGHNKKGYFKLKSTYQTDENSRIAWVSEPLLDFPIEKIAPESLFEAGIYAALSELIFSGFKARKANSNEKGDIIINLKNLPVKVYVRTCEVENIKLLHTYISRKNLLSEIDCKVFYIFVIRYKNSRLRNEYLVFNNTELLNYVKTKIIQNVEKLEILITLENQDQFVLNRKVNVRYYLNNFSLIK